MEGAKHPIHQNGVVAVVVAVCCVMYSVVPGTHHGPHLAMDAVVDVGYPHALTEEEDHVGHEMCWHKK